MPCHVILYRACDWLLYINKASCHCSVKAFKNVFSIVHLKKLRQQIIEMENKTTNSTSKQSSKNGFGRRKHKRQTMKQLAKQGAQKRRKSKETIIETVTETERPVFELKL